MDVDEFRCTPADHDRSRIGRAGDGGGHDRGVRYPKTAHTTYAELAVDHGFGVRSHSRRTDRVSEAARAHAHELDKVRLTLGLRTGDEFNFANPVEGLLAHQFPRGFRAPHSRLEIAIRA